MDNFKTSSSPSSFLSELSKVIQEGKLAKEQEEENKRKSFYIKYKVDEELVSAKGLLFELAKIKKEVNEIVVESDKELVIEESIINEPLIEEPKKEVTLKDFFKELHKVKTELTEKSEKIINQEPEPIVEIKTEQIEEVFQQEKVKKPKDIIIQSVESINKQQENYTNFFSEPKPKKPDANIKALQDKLKNLEQWVSKISTAGPGSGSYWLNDLGDTDKSSVKGATDGQVLTFNSSTKKWIAATPSQSGTTSISIDGGFAASVFGAADFIIDGGGA
jgi:hypothetical protein